MFIKLKQPIVTSWAKLPYLYVGRYLNAFNDDFNVGPIAIIAQPTEDAELNENSLKISVNVQRQGPYNSNEVNIDVNGYEGIHEIIDDLINEHVLIKKIDEDNSGFVSFPRYSINRKIIDSLELNQDKLIEL